MNRRQQKKGEAKAEREAWDRLTWQERLVEAETMVVRARSMLQRSEAYRAWLREYIIATEPAASAAWQEALSADLLSIGVPAVPEEPGEDEASDAER